MRTPLNLAFVDGFIAGQATTDPGDVVQRFPNKGTLNGQHLRHHRQPAWLTQASRSTAKKITLPPLILAVAFITWGFLHDIATKNAPTRKPETEEQSAERDKQHALEKELPTDERRDLQWRRFMGRLGIHDDNDETGSSQ